MNIKSSLSKILLKIGNFHFAFMADKGHKGQHLVLATKMLWQVKIQTQYTNRKEDIKEETLNIVVNQFWPL